MSKQRRSAPRSVIPRGIATAVCSTRLPGCRAEEVLRTVGSAEAWEYFAKQGWERVSETPLLVKLRCPECSAASR